jgi:hypothetical protein
VITDLIPPVTLVSLGSLLRRVCWCDLEHPGASRLVQVYSAWWIVGRALNFGPGLQPRKNVVKLSEPARLVRAVCCVLENPTGLFASHRHPANLLNVKESWVREIDLVAAPRLVGDGRRSLPESVSPFRVRVPKAGHVERDDRFVLDFDDRAVVLDASGGLRASAGACRVGSQTGSCTGIAAVSHVSRANTGSSPFGTRGTRAPEEMTRWPSVFAKKLPCWTKSLQNV